MWRQVELINNPGVHFFLDPLHNPLIVPARHHWAHVILGILLHLFEKPAVVEDLHFGVHVLIPRRTSARHRTSSSDQPQIPYAMQIFGGAIFQHFRFAAQFPRAGAFSNLSLFREQLLLWLFQVVFFGLVATVIIGLSVGQVTLPMLLKMLNTLHTSLKRLLLIPQSHGICPLEPGRLFSSKSIVF